MSNAKHWMFTINNPTEEYDYLIRALPYKYCICSYEMASTGTVHIQGYVSFSGCKKLSVLTKALPGAHFEVRRGSHQQAKDYCSKTSDLTFLDGPYELGDDSDIPNNQRQRTDLDEVKKALDEGAKMEDLWEKYFKTTARYYRAFEQYIDRKSTRLNSSHSAKSRMPSSA